MLIFNLYIYLFYFLWAFKFCHYNPDLGSQNLDGCISCVVIAAPSDGKKFEQKDDGLPVDIKLPIKHVLSRELQVYAILFLSYLFIYFF